MGYQYYYGYEYPSIQPDFDSAVGSAFGAVMGFVLVFYLLMLAVGVVFYILQSLGLYTIAKRRGINNPWLAWLPVGNMWIMGSISDQYQYVAKGRVRNRRKVLVGLILGMYAMLILIFGSLFSTILGAAGNMEALAGAGVATMLLAYLAMIVVAIVATVFQYIAMYDLYSSCDPDNAVLYLVLSIFFSICLPIFFFICRKKDGGMPPRKTVEQPQPILEPAYEPVETETTEEPQEPETAEAPEVPEEIQPQENQE